MEPVVHVALSNGANHLLQNTRLAHDVLNLNPRDLRIFELPNEDFLLKLLRIELDG